MATDIIARGMITEYIAGTNINFTENRDGTVEISASGSISSEDSVARDAIGNHKSDTSNPHNVTPAQIGLGNVDNTSDLDKPISTAVQKAIDNKADKTVATTSADGLMSAEDKTKLDSVGDTYALKSIYGDTTINVGRKANTTVGDYSTAEGYYTTASGNGSHAEGYYTTASEDCSHAEGYNATASGKWSHAEGNKTTASGNCSHAEGYNTTVSGQFSHAEGRNTTASGMCSHVGGTGTKALHDNEVAYGKYNESKDDTLFSIGDGTSDTARHNAFEITTTGGKLHDKDIATTDLIPTELPANGGNADTLDGLHATDFMPINGEVRKYGTIRMNGSDGIRTRHIDGNDTEADGALYLNWNNPDAPIYMNGGNTAIHSGNISSQSVNYANSAGNADTVDGLHASNFVNYTGRNFAQVNDPAYRVPYECIINSSDVKNTGLPDAKYWHIKYFMHSDSNGYGCQLAFPLNGSDYRPRYRTSSEMTWDKWKEISTTPIKSTNVSGTTNENGDIYLWEINTGNIPISACGSANTVFSPFINDDGSIYMLHAIDTYTDSPAANKSVNATVYYF